MFRFCSSVCALVLIALSSCGCSSEATNCGGPWVCPLWPLYESQAGTIFYCDLYETSCDDEPEAEYLIGSFEWPQYCPDCDAGGLSGDLAKSFAGLDEPITADYTMELPEGRARRFSRPSDSPDLRFLQFEDVNGAFITAKVFAFTIQTSQAIGGLESNAERTILVALQMRGAPTSKPLSLLGKPLAPRGNCRAYSAVYEPGIGQRFPILVLTAK
jgi:hypothetical protein